MSQIPGIHAYEKPVENDFEYVYTENKSKGFRRVTKAMMKVLLGVATKLSELENDTGFVDKTVADLKNYYLKTETYSKKELDDKIALIPKFSVKVVYSLPFEDIDENTIYLVPANDGDENLYTEYINVNGLWEILGTQKVPNVEVTKESIESALGYTPADNAEFRQLSDTVNDLLDNGTGTTDAVQYVEQTLTEEQQMQARENLGLYYDREDYETFCEMEVWTMSEKSIETNVLPDTIRLRLTQEYSTEYVLTVKTKYDYGSDVTTTWYGNYSLIDSSFSDSGDGIVIYKKEDDDWYIYIDYRKMENGTPHMPFTVEFLENRMKTIHVVIPEEYIPESIARKEDIPTVEDILNELPTWTGGSY